MSGGADLPQGEAASDTGSLRRLLVAAAVGAVACGGVLVGRLWAIAPLALWDGAAAAWLALTWRSMWDLDPEETARRSTGDDSGWQLADAILGVASIVSLVAIGLVLVASGSEQGATKAVLAGLGVASVALSWAVVHTIYTLRYARLYYTDDDGGVSFNDDDHKPCYVDFAYLSFTIGMTFQVSDTDLTTLAFRRSALKHGLLSYLFSTVLVATTINLVVGLTK